MSRLLINEPPLQVLPSLAVKVGLNEAIILQQIHYWAERSKVEIDGHMWVYNTIQQWREQLPFWSDDTIGRALKSLRESGLVIAARLSKDPFNKTLYYRIDYRNLQESEDACCASPITASCGNRSAQDASLSITETTVTETTAERVPRKRSTSPPAPEDVPAQVWADWLQLRKAKKAPVTDTVIQSARAEAIKAGMTLTEFLTEWCNRGSQGLKAEWLAGSGRQQPRQHDKDERDRLAMALLWPEAHGADVIEGTAR